MDDDRLAAAKRRLRPEAAAARAAAAGRAEAAAAAASACGHLTALPSYRRAGTVLWFVNLPREIDTGGAIEAALAEAGKRVAVPWCDDGGELALWRLESLAELQPGTWGIREPPAARRRDPARQVAAAEVDLVVAPGLAFDRRGRRLGHGKGYYDRLFARSSAVRVGLCYAAQVFPEVPAGPLDAAMEYVVTEEGAFRASPRPAVRTGAGRLSGGRGC